MLLTINLHWCLAFFLLFVLPGTASLPVSGQKGGSITLLCSLSNREDLTTVLSFGSKIAYGFNQDEHFKGRVHKSGSCDLNLQNLKTTDAGRYVSKVYAKGVFISSYTYDVHVNVNLTGRKDEELMFDDLPREAENVEHFTNTGWKEVWRKGKAVLTDQLTDKNGRLTIVNFTSSDEGTYRVLTSSGEILVNVTVTESSTGSKDKLDSTHEDKTHDTERVYVFVWIVIGVLVVLIAFAVIMKHQCQNRNEGHSSYPGVPMQETAQGPVLECLQCQQICRGSC